MSVACGRLIRVVGSGNNATTRRPAKIAKLHHCGVYVKIACMVYDCAFHLWEEMVLRVTGKMVVW